MADHKLGKIPIRTKAFYSRRRGLPSPPKALLRLKSDTKLTDGQRRIYPRDTIPYSSGAWRGRR
jgi:hypothetical protein